MLSPWQILIGIFIFMPFITLIHELGHVLSAKLCNCNKLHITLGVGRSIIKSDFIEIRLLYFVYGFTDFEQVNLSPIQDLIIASSGAIATILSIIIVSFLIHTNILSHYYFASFITFSEFALILVLLPIKYFNSSPSDGVRVFKIIKSIFNN